MKAAAAAYVSVCVWGSGGGLSELTCPSPLGDSCHATMPNIGQGAGLAFEDGYELAKTLGAAGDGSTRTPRRVWLNRRVGVDRNICFSTTLFQRRL